jgi:glyoxylase-like metal-dependent hydrolase (beta-lactamase superfamily II)
MIKRRLILKGLGAATLAVNLPLPGLAQTTFSTTDLGGGLRLISGAGSNVVVAEGPESVIVVNGGHQEHAQALLAEIKRLTSDKPISALFNTNWRPENTGLNYVLGPRGTTIIAHENTRLWQSAEFYSEWEDKQYTPIEKAAQANNTFYKTGVTGLGEERIEYGFISQMNTDGDAYVHFMKADVLVVGDMLGVGAYPLLDFVTGGWIVGAQKTTAGLLARTSATTKVIASAGGVQGKEQLQAQAAMLDHAYAKVSEAFKTGRSLSQFQEADPMAEFNAAWGDPALFLTLLYKSTWYRVPGRAVPGII